MRLFVALEIPSAVRTELVRRGERLRTTSPAARWVRPEAMHLTLLFFGEVASSRVQELEPSLVAAFRPYAPMTAQVVGAGCFPTPTRARVLWCGLEVQGELAALQSAVAAAGAPWVERRDDREFHAHLTLARCQPPWPKPAANRFVERFAPAAGEPFAVEHGVLFESTLGPGGSRYAELARLPLAGAGG